MKKRSIEESMKFLPSATVVYMSGKEDRKREMVLIYNTLESVSILVWYE